MNTNHALIEFSMYSIGFALVLPLAKAIQGYSNLTGSMLIIAAVAPLPLFIIRFRWAIPERLDSFIVYYAAAMCCIGLIMLITFGVFAIYFGGFA